MQESNLPMELEGLDPQYECPICLSCLKDPLLTSCGHRFCSSCLHTWLETKGERCPVDGGPLDKKSDLFLDRFTRREILSRKTICPTCKIEVSMGEVEEHLATHARGPAEPETGRCPFKSVGCEAEVTEDGLKEHLKMDVESHLSLIANSHLGLMEKMKNPDKASEALTQESAMWEPLEKGKDQQNASLMRALYERVVVLEQRCHEQSAQIKKLNCQLREAEEKVRDVSLRHACGQYLWRITDFTKKLAEMKSGEKIIFFSEGFYTSPIGYKICGRINLSPTDGDHLSLLIHLMKSPHDCILDWPFTGRIHLAAVHPTRADLSVEETVMTHPDLDSFKRPSREMNTKAFGYPRFVPVREILANGFLVDDTLLVKIVIQRV